MTEETKRRRGLALAAGLLLLALVATSMPVQVQAAQAKTGWVKKSGKKYYYKKGKKVTGWKKIQGKTYFFSSKGVMQSGKIVGNASGVHFVGKDGVRCLDPAIEVAKNLVLELTDSSMSTKEKLDTVYRYLVYDCSYLVDSYDFSPANFGFMARRMAIRRGGDCYEGALLMAYVGKVLGYKARLAEGFVDSNLLPSQVRYLAYNGANEHGWAEIRVGGTYLVYDVSMQRVYSPRLYSIPRSSYPYAIEAVGLTQLKVKAGSVVWE